MHWGKGQGEGWQGKQPTSLPLPRHRPVIRDQHRSTKNINNDGCVLAPGARGAARAGLAGCGLELWALVSGQGDQGDEWANQ